MNIAYKFYLNKLKNILTDCYNHKKEKIRILDLGCGDLSINPILNCGFDNFTSYVGIDAFKFDFPSNLSKDRISFINKNIFQISDTFDRKSFDIVFALDLIEHLEIKDGEKLIELMKKLAVHNIIIFTPNGFVEQIDPVNKFNCHISGWGLDYFMSRGYKSYPMYGFKIFRKEFCELKSPKIIFGALSLLSNLFITKFYPSLDLALLHKLEIK